jgi:hypothetical protein
MKGGVMAIVRILVVVGLFFWAATPAVVAAPLRYSVMPDKVIAYSVTITAETPSSVETMKGIIAYTGKGVDGEKMVLEYRGGLTKSTKTKVSQSGPPRGRGPGGPPRGPGGPRGPRGFGGPPIPRGPFDRPDFRGLTQTTSTMVVAPTGDVEKMTGDSQLPYVLGNLALLPFEPLPETEQERWQVGNGLTITEQSSSSRFGPRFGPFADTNEETVKSGGHETAHYALQNVTNELITISKNYSLSSPAATSDDSALEMDGSGTWVFDRAEGVSQSMEFKATLKVEVDNATVDFPLAISWQRMPDEEYAAFLQERADRMAEVQQQAQARREREAAAAKERAGKPLGAEEKEAIMADLFSSKWPTIANRLRKMGSFQPHPDDFDIALRVKELRSHKVVGVNMQAKKVWDRLEPLLEEADMTATPRDAADLSLSRTRTWSDNTGSFTVEAEFVKVEGVNVVLKRADGKELTVPLSRLSKESQAAAEQLRTADAVSNPFE